jgi:MoxR-like ATPase
MTGPTAASAPTAAPPPSGDLVAQARERLDRLRREVARVIVGQTELVDGLLIGLLCHGHVLVEGVPGLAKTTAIRSLAQVLGLSFGRIQFTPDLLPGDLTGQPIFDPASGTYSLRRGPVFTSLLLADEINRAPAKVQSALLEAMQERQVTIGDQTLALPDPFLVMATQNPVELEGTYPLPESQTDRFLLKLAVPYPSAEEEEEIVRRGHLEAPELEVVLDPEGVRALRDAALRVHVADSLSAWAVRLVRHTRAPRSLARECRSRADAARIRADHAEALELLESDPIRLGASPRASLDLVAAARAHALLEGRGHATPYDVRRMARDVLRHRISLGYEAEADGVRPDAVIEAVLDLTAAP